MLKSKGILTPVQKELMIELGKIKEFTVFYLSGGTALSDFFYCHRYSYDLDFFSDIQEVIIPMSRILEDKLCKKQFTVNTIRRFESFAELEVIKKKEHLKLHMGYDSPYHLHKTQLSEFNIKVNSYQDIIADKLLTYFGRWKHRDAIDLYFILKNEPVDSLLKMAENKDPGFDLYWFCVALKEVGNYSDDIKEWPVDLILDVNAKELKTEFLDLAFNLMGKIKK